MRWESMALCVPGAHTHSDTMRPHRGVLSHDHAHALITSPDLTSPGHAVTLARMHMRERSNGLSPVLTDTTSATLTLPTAMRACVIGTGYVCGRCGVTAACIVTALAASSIDGHTASVH